MIIHQTVQCLNPSCNNIGFEFNSSVLTEDEHNDWARHKNYANNQLHFYLCNKCDCTFAYPYIANMIGHTMELSDKYICSFTDAHILVGYIDKDGYSVILSEEKRTAKNFKRLLKKYTSMENFK